MSEFELLDTAGDTSGNLRLIYGSGPAETAPFVLIFPMLAPHIAPAHQIPNNCPYRACLDMLRIAYLWSKVLRVANAENRLAGVSWSPGLECGSPTCALAAANDTRRKVSPAPLFLA